MKAINDQNKRLVNIINNLKTKGESACGVLHVVRRGARWRRWGWRRKGADLSWDPRIVRSGLQQQWPMGPPRNLGLDCRADTRFRFREVVITANTFACSALSRELDGIEGFLGVDVMECVHARLPEGCSKTLHCAACEVRASVTYTVETGTPLCRVEAYLKVTTPQGNEKRQLFISTEKVGQTVLLRLDSVQKAAEAGHEECAAHH